MMKTGRIRRACVRHCDLASIEVSTQQFWRLLERCGSIDSDIYIAQSAEIGVEGAKL